MKICIIGSGGVGGYFGGKLALAENDVTFIARGEHLKAIQTYGLSVNSINGDFKIFPAKATDDIKQIAKTELIIIAVKAWQVKDISKDLRNRIDENCIILSLQNGVLAYDEISAELNKKFVLGGLCRILSKIGSPGVIDHTGLEPTLIFGEWDNYKTDRINKLKELFDKAGIKSSIAEDIQTELWKKFIAICVGGLLALTRSTYGIAREVPETREIMKELLTEIYTLAVKTGIKLSDDHVEKTMQYIDTFPHDARSSLTRDVMEGRPSEIEYQNGSVVKLGEKYGVNTPINKFIYHCLLPMELAARGKLK